MIIPSDLLNMDGRALAAPLDDCRAASMPQVHDGVCELSRGATVLGEISLLGRARARKCIGAGTT